MKNSFRLSVASLLLCAVLPCASATKAINHLPDNLLHLPATIEQSLTQFHTPGMSVGIIKDGEVVYLNGHGLRDVANQLPVTPDTWFRLASTSKAFTATTVAQLVDENVLSWNTRVTDVLPEFQMADPWVTRELDVTDLLTHRSGLGSGAGDSMLWPEPSGFSREEIIHNLRYLTPQYSFRRHYAYSNVMYITAGELVAHKTDMSWEARLQESIFKPLGMTCFGGDVPQSVLDNRALSYGHNDERGIYPIPRNQIDAKGIVSAAAGGISCNAPDMLRWLQMWLNDGKLPSGEALISEDSVEYMLTPHTILSVDDTDQSWDDMQFKAYGLGWRLMDIHGYKVVSHTGTLSGYQAYVAFVPELSLGVVVLNNGSNYGARGAVMQTILKGYMPEATRTDWVAQYQSYQDEREAKYLKNYIKPSGSGQVLLEPDAYTGTFADRWFGRFSLVRQGKDIRISSNKMPMLTGTVEPFDAHTFAIHWDNQNAASDTFIHFEVDVENNVNGFTLHPFTVKKKTNHEWRDMHFIKQED